MMTAMLTVENIEAGTRKWNVWNVNEDAEYHESGDEGEQDKISSEISDDRAAALESMRDVPTRIDEAADKDAATGKAGKKAA